MEGKKLTTRRDFLKLAAIASSGAALAACSAPTPAPAPEAPAAEAPAAEAPAAEAPAAEAPAEPAAAEKNVRLWVAWGNMNDAFQNEVWYTLPEYEEICPGHQDRVQGQHRRRGRHHGHRRGRPARGRLEHLLRAACHQERLPRLPAAGGHQQMGQGIRLPPAGLGLLQVLELRRPAGHPGVRVLPVLRPELQQGNGGEGRPRPEHPAHHLQRGLHLARSVHRQRRCGQPEAVRPRPV